MFNSYSNRIKSPCLNCIDREIGCHAHCQRYKEYSNKNNEQKQTVLKMKMKNIELNEHIKKQNEKFRRRSGR